MNAELQDVENSWSRQSPWGELSRDRMRSFIGIIKDHIYEDDIAIDFGGNDGYSAELWQDVTHSKMVVCDVMENRLDEAKKHGLETILADLSSIPDSRTFSWGFCSHVLEHVDDLEGALKEISKHIQFGVLFTIPTETEEEMHKSHSHVRCNADPEWWMGKIREAGFVTKYWRDGFNQSFDVQILAIKSDFADEFNQDLQYKGHACMSESEHKIHHDALEVRIRDLALIMGDEIKTSWLDFGGFDGHGRTQLIASGSTNVTICDFIDPTLPTSDRIPSNSFPYIFSSHTLEHVMDLDFVLSELHRIASIGAWIIVPLQNDFTVASYKTHWQHSADWGWWLDQFRSAGFKVKSHEIKPYFGGIELYSWLIK